MATRATTMVICGLALAVGGYLLFTQPGSPAAAPAPVASTQAVPSATPTPASVVPAATASSAAVPSSSTPSAPVEEGERRGVERFATSFMKALAKPAGTVSYRQWWAKVAGMLTDDAVDTYAGISPAVVPFRKVTGPVTLEAIDPDSDAFWVQPVQVGTDAGTYRLLVQLKSSGFADRLLVIEIQEP